MISLKGIQEAPPPVEGVKISFQVLNLCPATESPPDNVRAPDSAIALAIARVPPEIFISKP
jgi:hypothetical protein